MATVSATQDQAAARAQLAQREESAESAVPAPTRREFLYYIWGASIVLLLGEATAGFIWFIFPRFKEGEFGGVFSVAAEEIPEFPDAPPNSVPAGRFHISRATDGLRVLYAVCTHLGCLPKWTETNERFECPCHGSKFELDGGYIEGPAPRSLDLFPVTVVYADGGEVASEDGAPIVLEEGRPILEIRVDTGNRIQGAPA